MSPKLNLLTNILAAGVLLLACGASLAQGNGPQTRVINLESQVSVPLNEQQANLPNGTVKLNNYNGNFPNEYRIAVNGLVTLSEDEIYGFYTTLQASPDDYVPGEDGNSRILFNVNDSGSWSVFLIDFDDVFDEPTITAFVVRERDDGDEFEPGTDLVILKGTSFQP